MAVAGSVTRLGAGTLFDGLIVLKASYSIVIHRFVQIMSPPADSIVHRSRTVFSFHAGRTQNPPGDPSTPRVPTRSVHSRMCRDTPARACRLPAPSYAH